MVFNYIDDIYVCVHVDQALQVFEAPNKVILDVGLPINPEKVFVSTTVL